MISGTLFRELQNYVIKNFDYEKDYDYNLAINDSLISHLVSGDLDDMLFSDADKSTLKLLHQYQGLCFYDGNHELWLDSVEDYNQIDESLSAYQVLNNFMFLYCVAKDGGKETLEQLSKFQDYEGYNESSVIEYLRNTFGSDALLEQALLIMSNPSSLYSVFTDEQKAELLTFPEGTVYFYGENGPELSHPLLLSMEIYNRMKEGTAEVTSLDEFSNMALELNQLIGKSFDFSNTVRVMSNDYHEAIRRITGGKPKNMYELFHDYRNDMPQAGWSIDQNELVKMLNTPYNPISSDNSKEKNKMDLSKRKKFTILVAY